MRKPALLITILALATFGFTACGDDEEDTTSAETSSSTTETTSGGGGEGGTVAITADPDGALAYEETEATVPAGEVTVEFDNPSSLGHDVVVEDDSGELIRTDVVSGDSTTASGTLEAGEYTFYCSVDGHADAGMEGTLTVE